jgi:REP element-mobilizing transposase RayT
VEIITIKKYQEVILLPRDNRVVFEGAIYHIYQRGNNKEFIFGNGRHKAFILKQIKEYKKCFDFELLAYGIMDNHYHLLIKTNKSPINEIMFNINNVIGKYLNRELKRTGHIFEDRYKSKLVENDAYLIWLIRYIHRNPVRAHICDNVDDYRWSSHNFYKNGSNNFVLTSFILKTICSDLSTAIKQYLKLVNVPEEEDNFEDDFNIIKKQFELNDTNTLEEKDEVITYNLKSLIEILGGLNLDQISKELLISGSKKHSITGIKIKFIKESIINKHSLNEIGKFLNTSQSAVSKILDYYNISLY